MDLQAARKRLVGRLIVGAGSQNPLPAERIDHQRSGDLAPIGVDHMVSLRVLAPPLTLAVSNSASHWAPEHFAKARVVKGGEGPGDRQADRTVGGVDEDRVKSLLLGFDQPQLLQPAVGIAQAEVWRSPIS